MKHEMSIELLDAHALFYRDSPQLYGIHSFEPK